jgi:nucleoid-associated protein YgaU
MTVTSKGRIVAPSAALVAACGAALFFGINHLRSEPPVETSAAIAAAAALPPASGDRDAGLAVPATAQAEAATAAAAFSVSPRSPNDEPVPAFDIARIEQTGDAVIAGRAAPGAIVELLRDGERHDRVVADQSGQFVMVPPRLPPGNYELTLRSRRPDGRQAISEQRVAVVLDKAESSSGTVGSRAAVKFDVPQTRVANGRPPHVTAVATNAAPLSDAGASPAVAASGIATTIVSRGDSLWRISRATYGAGMRYAVVYKANRNQIRNPDLIYPGQIFVLPGKAP